MKAKNMPVLTWIVMAAVLLATMLAILYNQGSLNLGALGGQPGTECPQDAKKEDTFCVYTIQPLGYYIIKDETNFVLYGPTVNKIFTDNKWNFSDGNTFNGRAYSIVKGGYTEMTYTFKLKDDKKGGKVPSFVFDYPTAENIQGSRYVEVNLPNSIKIRFDTFNLPDKKLLHR